MNNEWMNGWMDGWMIKQMNEWMPSTKRTHNVKWTSIVSFSQPVLLILTYCVLYTCIYNIHVSPTKQQASLFIRYCINCIMWNT